MKTKQVQSVLEALSKDGTKVCVKALSADYFDTYEIHGKIRFGGASRFMVQIPEEFPPQARAYFRARDVTKIEIQPNSLFGTGVLIRVRHEEKEKNYGV